MTLTVILCSVLFIASVVLLIVAGDRWDAASDRLARAAALEKAADNLKTIRCLNCSALKRRKAETSRERGEIL